MSPIGSAVVAAFWAGLAAGLAAALVRIAGALHERRSARPSAWSAPLALGIGGATGFVLTRGWPAFPPAESLHWIFYFALGAGLLGVHEALRGKPSHLVRALASVIVPLFLLEFQRENHWGRVEGILWTAGLAAVLFATWSLLARFKARGGNGVVGWGLATVPMTGAVALAGGALLSQLALALGAALGACVLLGPGRRIGGSGVAPYAILHCSIVWEARYLCELSSAGFVLLSLAPLAVLLGASGTSRALRLVTVLGPALLAGAALAVEAWAAPAPYAVR